MRPDYKKLALTYFPYLIFLWVFDKAGECYRLAAGADMPIVRWRRRAGRSE